MSKNKDSKYIINPIGENEPVIDPIKDGGLGTLGVSPADLSKGPVIKTVQPPDSPVEEASEEDWKKAVENAKPRELAKSIIELPDDDPKEKARLLVEADRKEIEVAPDDGLFVKEEIPEAPLVSANGHKPLSKTEREDMKTIVAAHMTKIIQALGMDLNDPNLTDTPKRIAKMYVDEIFSGKYCPAPTITTFPSDSNEMVYLGNIDFTSTCSHHFVFFTGKAYIAYVPNEKLVGISKLARITDWFAKRPQLQENMTTQIADMIMKELDPHGVAVHLEASHGCMTARGVQKPGAIMKTTVLRGCFELPEVREEFFNKVKMDK